MKFLFDFWVNYLFNNILQYSIQHGINDLVAQMSVYMNLFIDLFFCLQKDISSVKDVLPSDWHINPPQGICAFLRLCCHAAAVPDRIQSGLREQSNKSDVFVHTATVCCCLGPSCDLLKPAQDGK